MVSDRLLTNKKMTQRKAKEIRREEILATALRLFAEKGYNATSMRDLAGAVGLTEGALYKHFAGKQELFEASIERVIGMRDAILMQTGAMDLNDIRPVLRVLGRAVLHFIMQGDGQYVFRIFVQDAHQAVSSDGLAVRDRFVQGLSLLSAIFQQARDAGVLRVELDPQFLARQFGGTLISTAVMQKVIGLEDRLPLDVEIFVDQFVDVFLAGARPGRQGVQ